MKVDASMMSCAYSPATGVNAIDFEHSANHTGITLLFDHDWLGGLSKIFSNKNIPDWLSTWPRVFHQVPFSPLDVSFVIYHKGVCNTNDPINALPANCSHWNDGTTTVKSNLKGIAKQYIVAPSTMCATPSFPLAFGENYWCCNFSPRKKTFNPFKNAVPGWQYERRFHIRSS